MTGLPTGTVTFLFSDIEGSTRLLQRLGLGYAGVLTQHQALLRAAWSAHGGYEVDTQGDSFFVAFPTARDALAAAVEAQRALAGASWPEGGTVRVRMGLHTGAPQPVGDHYVGLDVHRAARIAAAGHGGQMLLSEATRALVEHDLPVGALLRGLGVHRLKDLPQAEPLYQLVLDGLPSDFPPLRTLHAPPNNLPIQPTALLGREEMVATVTALLQRDQVRLVTLTGPGGIGKTRLSIQVAAEVGETFPDGVWFVRLSRLTDPALALPTVAQTLGLREAGGQPIAQTLRDYVRDKRFLLVLDNFEQLVEAAPDVAGLLDAGPRLKALVTSRVVLRLRGEKEVAVPPLPLAAPAHRPRVEQLAQSSAVALFVARAQDARPTFQLTAANAAAVAEICAQLDGLPLAIELAAARVKLLPPAALLARLTSRLTLLVGGARDLEERQQTMRATIGWSEALLSPEERRLFRRLAIFVGSGTIEAAEAVCAAPEDAEPLGLVVLDGVAALVDQSLAQQREEGEEGGAGRFGLLHVIREFGLERLEESGEAETLRRGHAEYYLELVEGAEPELTGPRAGAWLDRLEREHDNVRAALSWARERGEEELGLRLAAAVWRFWWVRGYLSEGRGWLEDPLGAADPGRTRHDLSARVRARALSAAGYLAAWQGDYGPATAWLERGMAQAREAGDLRTLAAALNSLGIVASHQRHLDAAAAQIAESLEVARQAGDQWGSNRAQGNLGFIAYFRGDTETAARLLEEPLAFSRQVDDREFLGVLLALAGSIARKRGQLVQAGALQQEALTLHWGMGNLHRVAETLEMLAATAGAMDEGKIAARLLGTAAALRETIGLPQPVFWRTDTEAAVAPVHAAMGDEAWATALADGRALSLGEAVAKALAGIG
jgi:predicted ATPase/class 3 adenylate cyclase